MKEEKKEKNKNFSLSLPPLPPSSFLLFLSFVLQYFWSELYVKIIRVFRSLLHSLQVFTQLQLNALGGKKASGGSVKWSRRVKEPRSQCALMFWPFPTRATHARTHTHTCAHARTNTRKQMPRAYMCQQSRAFYAHIHNPHLFLQGRAPPSLASVPKFHFTKLSRPHLPRPRLSLTSPQHNNTTYTRTIFILKLLPLRHTLQTPRKVGVLRA